MLNLTPIQKQNIKRIIPTFDFDISVEGQGKEGYQKQQIEKATQVAKFLLNPMIREVFEKQIKEGRIDSKQIKLLVKYTIGQQYIGEAQKAGGPEELEWQQYGRDIASARAGGSKN